MAAREISGCRPGEVEVRTVVRNIAVELSGEDSSPLPSMALRIHHWELKNM
jgi:hypothetical protein